MSTSGTKTRTGLRRTPYGWQAFVYVRGKFYSKRYPADTKIRTMQDWRESRRVRAKIDAELAPPTDAPPTFAQDAARYLETIGSMPSAADRRLHIARWVQRFGDRQRSTIAPFEIRAELERLIATGYTPASANRHRTALMALYSALDGRAGRNPVRDVPRYQEASQPRQQPVGTIYRVLACMRPSRTRARLRVLLWTGWPHRQIAQLRPEHVDLERARAYVTPRKKGKGHAGKWLPLLPPAVVALREFHREDAYCPIVDGKLRPFSASAMHKAWTLALEKFNAHRARFDHPPIRIRPYDLRHTFGTFLAEHTTDERAIQELMLHSRAEQSRRYTEAATAARVRAAVGSIASDLASQAKVGGTSKEKAG